MEQKTAYEGAVALAQKIAAKEISSVELTQLYIDRIQRYDNSLNLVPVRTFEKALEDAAAADEAVAAGASLGPLHGVPMTIKESYVMADTPATWGLEPYKDNVAREDGLAVARFRSAGAHFLGKTNVPVDLADIQSYNPIYGQSNNPWNEDHTPGGSSGGSAGALAAGFSALEAGSDIGGSIRTPAHFSGVFGHKPTWGIVPMAGHELMSGVPDADLSVCGPLARDPADLEVALDVMAGPTSREAKGWQLNLAPAAFKSLKDLRVAIWPTDDMAPVTTETADRVAMIGDTLAQLGATVSDTARPDFDLRKAHLVYQNLLTAVMSSAQPESMVAKVQEKVSTLEPEDQSAAAVNLRASIMRHRDWIRHNFRREKLREAWDSFFGEWDILICPQTPTGAIKHDHRPFEERTIEVDGVDRPYNEGFFWAGLVVCSYLPSTVFPTGPGANGLPIGIQAVSGPYDDYKSIAFARLIAEEIGGFTPPPNMLG
ncbi:MAG: amidase [Pseudomonadota bacterium]